MAFSYVVLTIVSSHCLLSYLREFPDFLPLGTFLAIFMNSMVGLSKCCGGVKFVHNTLLSEVHDSTSFLQMLVALPFLTTEIWLMLRYDRILSWLHSALCVVPLMVQLMEINKNDSNYFNSMLTGSCCMSLAVASLEEPFNVWCSLAAVTYSLVFLISHDMFDRKDSTVQDFENFFLCAFCCAALNALRHESKKSHLNVLVSENLK
ncbi:uncharacterized protein LOC108735729 [Agrilus planipennis]|uniref:Uncharacterized protein LOC108735729 n=1 Tax=Agrilus planipennis TaxID=224129 RepID=A0A1W4WHD3_AGRPL|nr:uncharacterized protein LOC108735729 [Agrilus planipennis]